MHCYERPEPWVTAPQIFESLEGKPICSQSDLSSGAQVELGIFVFD